MGSALTAVRLFHSATVSGSIPWRQARCPGLARLRWIARRTAMLSVVWFVYPVIPLIDPEGLRWIGSTASVACIAILDLTAKVAYGLFSTARHSRIADADVAEGANPRTSLHADSIVPVGEGTRARHSSAARVS